jgi:phage recombination protein Bet
MTTKQTTTTAVAQPNGNGAKPERTASNSVIVRMAQRFQMDPVAFERTIKATCIPGSGNVSNEQFAAFLLVADQHGLNPLTKEIYAFPSKGGGIVPIVGIDGWYKLANAHPQFDGIQFEDSADGHAITARVYRKDRSHPIEATEYMVECHRKTEPWDRWPRRMLRHKAAIQAIRAAFGFAGVYDPD